MSLKIQLAALFSFPFLVTAIERLLIQPLFLFLSLDLVLTNFFKLILSIILLFGVAAVRNNSYGIISPRRNQKMLIAFSLLLLLTSSLFLYSMKVTSFFQSFSLIYLFNWILTVFREEFVLRGVIQTESESVLKSKFWKISSSIWFTTIAFSLWHIVNFPALSLSIVLIQMIISLPSGIIFGFIREKTGSTLLSFLIHISGDLLFFSLYTLIFQKLFFPLW